MSYISINYEAKALKLLEHCEDCFCSKMHCDMCSSLKSTTTQWFVTRFERVNYSLSYRETYLSLKFSAILESLKYSLQTFKIMWNNSLFCSIIIVLFLYRTIFIELINSYLIYFYDCVVLLFILI